jgi:hypothetical protein
MPPTCVTLRPIRTHGLRFEPISWRPFRMTAYRHLDFEG